MPRRCWEFQEKVENSMFQLIFIVQFGQFLLLICLKQYQNKSTCSLASSGFTRVCCNFDAILFPLYRSHLLKILQNSSKYMDSGLQKSKIWFIKWLFTYQFFISKALNLTVLKSIFSYFIVELSFYANFEDDIKKHETRIVV